VGEIVIRDGEAGRQGSRWHKVTFTLDLRVIFTLNYKTIPYKLT